MFHVAIQVKELISSNVTHLIDNASNPAKVLHRLQREIEEAVITLGKERTLNRRAATRLETALAQNEKREADWNDKAKIAMNHDREDLARQALMAREECRETIGSLKEELAKNKADGEEIDAAIGELEAKREDVREQARAQIAADADIASTGTPGIVASKADQQLSRIAVLEKRADFATEDHAEKRGHAGVDREIEEMRRQSAIDAEIAAMKPTSTKRTARKKSK